MEVGLRGAKPKDALFFQAVYASTRAEEMAAVPWSDDQKNEFVAHQFTAQSRHYAQHYSGMTSDVVLVNGAAAGRLLVARWSNEIRVVDIALLPEFRGRGAGTTLLRKLQEEAAAAGKSLTIHVEKFNPALRLYERLGFAAIEDKEVYVLMKWEPECLPGAVPR